MWPPEPTLHGGTTQAIVIGPRASAVWGSSASGRRGYALRTNSHGQSPVHVSRPRRARAGLAGHSYGVKLSRPSSDSLRRTAAGSRSARVPMIEPAMRPRMVTARDQQRPTSAAAVHALRPQPAPVGAHEAAHVAQRLARAPRLPEAEHLAQRAELVEVAAEELRAAGSRASGARARSGWNTFAKPASISSRPSSWSSA